MESNVLIDQIERELESLDTAPFRRVLSRLLASLARDSDERLDAMPPDKRIRAARDFSMLIGYATPLVNVTHNHLHVEQLTDAQLLLEQRAARHALDNVMARSLLEAQSVPAAGGSGGLGSSEPSHVDVQGDPPAEKTIAAPHAAVIEPAPGPAPVRGKRRGRPL